MQGDAEASRDVIGFFQGAMEPFRALGVAVLIIDHQSKLQAGQTYQHKGAFGSVFKSNLARSVLQVEATERGEGTLTARVRQKKHNFGPLAEPFGIKLDFSEESVTLEAVELGAAELAEEATLNAAERVKLALEAGSAYPWEIADITGIPLKIVKNTLTGLRKQGSWRLPARWMGARSSSGYRPNVPIPIRGMGRGTVVMHSPTCTSTSKGRRSFERWGNAVRHL